MGKLFKNLQIRTTFKNPWKLNRNLIQRDFYYKLLIQLTQRNQSIIKLVFNLLSTLKVNLAFLKPKSPFDLLFDHFRPEIQTLSFPIKIQNTKNKQNKHDQIRNLQNQIEFLLQFLIIFHHCFVSLKVKKSLLNEGLFLDFFDLIKVLINISIIARRQLSFHYKL